LGQAGEDAQRLLQGANGEQAGGGDDRWAVESDVERLRAEVPEGKVAVRFGDQDREPPQASKRLAKSSLDSARGPPFKGSVRNPG
jgi:hypothetical protein